MFKRSIEDYIHEIKDRYRCITFIGPRQSGKTTLARYRLFPDFSYVSLENPDIRMRAHEDPRGFFSSITTDAILDEVQRAPDLISYLQEILDDPNDNRKFVLTGSDSLLLSDRISQSLAGRSRILKILPLSMSEIPLDFSTISLDEALWQGCYPRIFNEKLKPDEWYGDYYQTYVEKDVRSLINVENVTQFDRFVKVCASRAGQLANYSSIGSEVGMTQTTAIRWGAVLESSFIMFSLMPHFKNFSKRIIKSPKLYFYDTGLLCWLLGIHAKDQLYTHPLRGSIFENFVISEIMKRFINQGKEAPLFFWRDQHGHEIDLIIDRTSHLECIEIKSSQTFHVEFIDQIKWLNKLQKKQSGKVIYGGNNSFVHDGYPCEGWRDFKIACR